MIACLAAPFAGFAFNAHGKTGAGLGVAWLPPAGGLVALMIPAPYLKRPLLPPIGCYLRRAGAAASASLCDQLARRSTR